MEDKDFEELQQSIQYAILECSRLQAIYRKETGKDFIISGPVQKNKFIQGFWHKDDLRKIFVDGAKWWEFYSTGRTMWPSEVRKAEWEATDRYK